MISQVEARGYRCLRETTQSLEAFEVLVGPNGSGKSAFMDVIAFLGALVSTDLSKAVSDRTQNFHDLVWGRDAGSFELAVEARIPKRMRAVAPDVGELAQARYEVRIRIDPMAEVLSLVRERVVFLGAKRNSEFPVIVREGPAVLYKDEVFGTEQTIATPPNISVLAGLPAGPKSPFTVCEWLRRLLREEVQQVRLDAKALAMPSPPFKVRGQMYDGSYLVRMVARLQQDENPAPFEEWLKHVRTSLPDIAHVRTVLRHEDQHRYLMVRFDNGLEIPSWALSEGTLRLLALTILAYVPDSQGVYLIEEPENGVHPTAIETIFQSLTSVYDGQVLIATHSPVLLSLAKPEQLLCFTKTHLGTETIRGDKHPVLKDWKGEVNISDFFAAGVLG